MKLKHILTHAVMFGCLSLSIPEVNAEIVPVNFASCKADLSITNEIQGVAPSSSFIFTNISLGHTCGTVQARYLRGENHSNELPAGATCVVRATLKNSSGAVVAGRQLTVRDNTNRLIARGKTHENGAVRFRFKNRSARTEYFLLIGPRSGPNNSRLGCYVYADHCANFGSAGVEAKVC